VQDSKNSIVVFSVLIGGILLFIFAQRPHSVCDSQIEIFMDAQKGGIYPQQIKNVKRPAFFGRYEEACKSGNSPGACYELFGLLRRLIRDLDAAPVQCLPEMATVSQLGGVLGESLDLMTQLAWGGQPPAPGQQRLGWLETSDLSLFCSLKRKYTQIFGEDEFQSLRGRVLSKLPGEPVQFKDGVCSNCDSRKTANEILSPDEIWVRSLFSVRCELY